MLSKEVGGNGRSEKGGSSERSFLSSLRRSTGRQGTTLSIGRMAKEQSQDRKAVGGDLEVEDGVDDGRPTFPGMRGRISAIERQPATRHNAEQIGGGASVERAAIGWRRPTCSQRLDATWAH